MSHCEFKKYCKEFQEKPLNFKHFSGSVISIRTSMYGSTALC
jgi:hypothetical protein